MPVIKVSDIAYGRIRSPDLDQQEDFLTNFGMVRADRTKTAPLYAGHRSRAPHPRDRASATPGSSASHSSSTTKEISRRPRRSTGPPVSRTSMSPGGGKRVRLTEPHGYPIEIVCGMEMLDPLPVRKNVVNYGLERTRRVGELTRLPKGPSQVKRLGHAVIMTPNLANSVAWYRETLGLISSDDVYVGSEDNIIATFNRCDRGKEYVDHHVFLNLQGDRAGLNHMAFEVQDMDDVFMGHEHLKEVGKYEHFLGPRPPRAWEPGIRLLGPDPWGRVHEHWTDSDLLNVPKRVEPALGRGRPGLAMG